MGGLFGGNTTIATQDQRVAGVKLQTSAFGLPVPILYGKAKIAGNVLWYGQFTTIPHTTTQSSGGKGGGVTQTNTTFTYTASVLFGLCEGTIVSIGTVWKGKKVSSAASLGFVTFTGTYSQVPWGNLTTNFPSQALGYRGNAYAAVANYDLGTGATLENHLFEVQGPFAFGGGVVDANPKDIVVDFLTNANYGAVPSGLTFGTLTQFSNYCAANGIFFSPVVDQQKAAAQYVDEWVKAANSRMFLSEGVLKIVPYGDKTITGNGVTFTPNLTPAYDLTDDDFLGDKQDPIQAERKRPADAYNQFQIEFLNRANSYNIEIADVKDQANIELFGLRPGPTLQAHAICDITVARNVSQLLLQRGLYVRNMYRFKLGWSKVLLEPMDLVTITDPVFGTKIPVRILEITETDTGQLEFLTEEHLGEVNSHSTYGAQAGAGYSPNYNVAPGSVNAPYIFDAPGILAVTGYEVWAAVAGGVNWGGANVWVSTDASTYKQVGVIYGNARYGVTVGSFASGSDPDITNTLSVDLTTSRGALVGGTQADADAFNTLALVDGELISFQAATLTSQYKYTLGTYLRRGVYRSAVGVHAGGKNFARLDQAIAKIPYDPSLVGKTINLKFQSFNSYGAATEDISTVTAYPYTIAGSASYPSNVTGFTASQNGAAVIFTWDLLTAPLNPNIDGYEIRYTPQGDLLWNDGTPLTQVTRGTQVTSVRLPPGAWTCMIKARDSSNNYSQTAAYANINVTNTQTVIFSEDQTKGWPNQELAISNTASVTGSAITLGAPLSVEWSGSIGSFVTTDKLAYSGTGNTANNWALYVDATGKAVWSIIDNGTVSHAVQMASALSAGVPHHLLGVYDGTNITLYVDGAQVATLAPGAMTFSSTTAPVFAPPATGNMCEARIYNRALSASEITARYQGFNNTSGLLLDYLFNYQSLLTAGQVVDQSASANTGTIAGTPSYAPSSFANKFVAHPLGYLVPESTLPAASGATGYEVFDNFVQSPFEYCTYDTRIFDLNQSSLVRLHGELLANLGPGVTSGIANPTMSEDDEVTLGTFHGFAVWTIGNVTCRYFKMRAFMDTVLQGLGYIKGFTPTADGAPFTQSGTVVVGAAGTTITYPVIYHSPPSIKATVLSGTALSVTVLTVSSISFVAHVFNSSGTEVGGTILWESTGV